MTKSNFESKVTASPGGDAKPENASESFGKAAETGGDLATEGNGRELVRPLPDTEIPAENLTDNSASERIVASLDPICGKSLDQNTLLHLERDGKIFYFCSERCLQTFISAIAGVKSESKAGSCCG